MPSCKLLNFVNTAFILVATFFSLAYAISDEPALSSVTLSSDAALSANSLQLVQSDNADDLKVMGPSGLIAGYVKNSNGKPIVFPVMSPSGKSMTRGWPMVPLAEFEKDDHYHQRSMWFTHGEVNGFDFWGDDVNEGDIVEVQRQAKQCEDGAAEIVTSNDWIAPTGQRVLSDQRVVRFFVEGGRNIIDFTITLKATDGDVLFGDTKEGTFGIRVAGSMNVDAKLGGIIVNAEGLTNTQAWGKHSAWVDYSGPVNQSTVGVTIHDHPQNLAYPCRWHVRDYGLFAANPFGEFHFTGGTKTAGYVLPSGNELTLRYRVVVHEGGLQVPIAQQDATAFAAKTFSGQ